MLITVLYDDIERSDHDLDGSDPETQTGLFFFSLESSSGLDDDCMGFQSAA